MAILMLPFLRLKYRSKFLIDIRDYSFENNPVFYYLEKKAISYSGLAVISSEGYKKFLPPWDYVLCHNDPTISKDMINSVVSVNRVDKPIQISFIGLVRFYSQNKKLLDLLANDERFVVAFYGQNSEPLKEYAESAGINNVVFKGRFDPIESIEFYKNTDIINNFYGNHSPLLDYALSNKLYFAASFRKPILVCPDTFMYEIASRFGFGILLDDNIKNPDQLYEKYRDIDRAKMNKGCEAFLEEVYADNKTFRNKISEFING